MTIKYTFEEVDQTIKQAIQLVGETFRLGSRPYNTFSGKRLWKEIITDTEAAKRMVQRAKHYKGGDIDLTQKEIDTLLELVTYCSKLSMRNIPRNNHTEKSEMRAAK